MQCLPISWNFPEFQRTTCPLSTELAFFAFFCLCKLASYSLSEKGGKKVQENVTLKERGKFLLFRWKTSQQSRGRERERREREKAA